MKRTLYATAAALMLAVAASCMHPHHGRPGGPGSPGCPQHGGCGCKCRHQQGGTPRPDCPQPNCPQQQAPAPAK